jgi:hypothetical protein
MSSSYSSNLRVELIGSGDQAGTWGTTTDNNFSYIFDSAIAGYQSVDITVSPYTLTSLNGATPTAASNQAIYAALRIYNSPANLSIVYAPAAASKIYVIWNDSSYSIKLYNTGYSTGPTIAAGAKVLVFSTGTAFYEVLPSSVSGTVAVVNGGTGANTFTSGALLKGAGTSPVTVATAADIVGQIGATAVTNATNATTATNATNATNATTATNATRITNSGGWNVTPSGTKLYFNYNGTDVASLDSSGNLIVLANITAYGTP